MAREFVHPPARSLAQVHERLYLDAYERQDATTQLWPFVVPRNWGPEK